VAGSSNTHPAGDHKRNRTEKNGVNDPTKIEVDFFEAMSMTDVPEEILGKLAEEGKLKSRRADGTIYFLREQIEELVERQADEARSAGLSGVEL
jgi:hypothetical protein